MITELLLSQGQANTAVGLGAVRVPLGSGRAEDLYAIWNAVFEHAHAGVAPRGGQQPTTGGQHPAQKDQQSDADPNGRSHVTALVESAGEGAAAEPVSDFGVGSKTVNTRSAVGDAVEASASVNTDSGDTDEPHAIAQQTELLGAETAHVMPRDTETFQQSQERQQSQKSRAAPTGQPAQGQDSRLTAVPAAANPPESVSVYVRDSLVAIVVRDASLTDQNAMQCAFATAQALTGQRAALQRLTLNGKILYQQPPDLSASPAGAAPVLTFAC